MRKQNFTSIISLVAAIAVITFISCSKENKSEPVPVITEIFPTCGVVGSAVTIYGDQFIPTVPVEKGRGPHPNTSIVTLNGIVVEAKNVYQDSLGKQSITIEVPEGAASGKITITANGNSASSPEEFMVTIPSYVPNVEVTTLSTYGNRATIDLEGNLYIARKEPSEIVRISRDGNIKTLWSSTNGDLATGIVVDEKGNIYASILGHYVLKIDKNGKTNIFAGSKEIGYLDGTETDARFSLPFGIGLDIEENIIVSDVGNHKIRKITPNGVVSTLAGSTNGYLDGPAHNAKFNTPWDIASDAAGNVYVADGSRIRKISKDGQVSTVAGGDRGYKDGPTANAKFMQIYGIECDSKGNLYLCEIGNPVVRRITTDGIVQTVAGSTYGIGDGSGTIAKFGTLLGITKNVRDTFYVTQEGPMRKIVIN